MFWSSPISFYFACNLFSSSWIFFLSFYKFCFKDKQFLHSLTFSATFGFEVYFLSWLVTKYYFYLYLARWSSPLTFIIYLLYFFSNSVFLFAIIFILFLTYSISSSFFFNCIINDFFESFSPWSWLFNFSIYFSYSSYSVFSITSFIYFLSLTIS